MRTVLPTLTPYEQTFLILQLAGIPLHTIPPETVAYYLRLGRTPEQIAIDVWQLRPDQVRKDS